MRKLSRPSSNSGGLTTAGTPIARTAVARRSIPAAGRTVRYAGAARPAGRISASRQARCSRSIRCRSGPTCLPSRSSVMKSKARACWRCRATWVFSTKRASFLRIRCGKRWPLRFGKHLSAAMVSEPRSMAATSAATSNPQTVSRTAAIDGYGNTSQASARSWS